MPTLSEIVHHPEPTGRGGYRYVFTPKHHGADPDAAQWLPALTLEEEFSVFDGADDHELTDDEGALYGVLLDGEDGLRSLGTWNQQVAEFPAAREGEPWHGYPLYPLKDQGPENRRGQQLRPETAVFNKMVGAGLITRSQRRRLMKGDHA